MSEYTLQAEEFLKKNNIRFSYKEPESKICDWDNKTHFMFKCRFVNRNTNKSMTVNFFSSLNDYWNDVEEIEAYDVLECLTKYDVGSIDDFVSEFGYEVNSWEDVKKIQKTYKSVVREWKNVQRVFGDCLEELQEIN